MLRVLIIDDNPLFLDALAELLHRFSGVSVIGTADNGEEGLRASAALLPDMVFVDLNMPGMGGMEVAGHLRRLLPHIQVVIISLHDNAEYRERAAEVGATHFICKKDLLTELMFIISYPPAPPQSGSAPQ